MKTSADIRRRGPATGSTILMGLAIMTMATFGITAWVSLLSARGAYIEGIEVSSNHRIARMNAHAATEEFLYRNYLTKTSTTGTNITLPDGSATISIPPSILSPLGSFALSGGVVATGMASGRGYHVELPVSHTIKVDHDNNPSTTPLDSTYTRNYLLKSRAPQLAGDLMMLHRPTLSPWVNNDLLGHMRIYGNTVIWDESSHSVDNRVRSERYITYTAGTPNAPDRVRNLSNSWVPPTNYPLMATTGGDFGSSNGYEGTLNVIDPGPGVPWSMKNQLLASSYISLSGDVDFDSGRGARSNGNGRIDITLGNIHLTHVLITDHVRVINLHGQTTDSEFADADLRSAIMILYQNTTSSTERLRNINFYGRNNRRLSLGLKRDGFQSLDADLAFRDANTNPSWRLVITAENTRLRENDGPNGLVTIYGGVRTDRDFRWGLNTNETLHIRKETDPKLLERLVPRTAWIESYAN